MGGCGDWGHAPRPAVVWMRGMWNCRGRAPGAEPIAEVTVVVVVVEGENMDGWWGRTVGETPGETCEGVADAEAEAEAERDVEDHMNCLHILLYAL